MLVAINPADSKGGSIEAQSSSTGGLVGLDFNAHLTDADAAALDLLRHRALRVPRGSAKAHDERVQVGPLRAPVEGVLDRKPQRRGAGDNGGAVLPKRADQGGPHEAPHEEEVERAHDEGARSVEPKCVDSDEFTAFERHAAEEEPLASERHAACKSRSRQKEVGVGHLPSGEEESKSSELDHNHDARRNGTE